MEKPKIADTRPAPVKLKAGETVYWCSCGRSKTQPFCDGAHRGSVFEPVAFTAETDDKYFFCQCKRTGKAPLCDGSHKNISQNDLDEQQGLKTTWYRVAAIDALQEDGVLAVQAGSQSIALTFYRGQYTALDNACPHQGGPLAEGAIECDGDDNCWLRCPWHGWDFHPQTGKSPGEFNDGVAVYPLEVRDDGIYVAVKEVTEHQATISDLMVSTMVSWGVRNVFGMVGHSNLGLADAMRRESEQGRLRFIGIRHEGAAAFAASAYAKLTGKPGACLSIAGPGATNLLTGLWDARVDRAPVLALTGQINTQVLGPGAFQEIDLAAAYDSVSCFSQTVLPDSNHAELMNLACKHAIVQRDVAHLIFPDEVQNIAIAENAAAGDPGGRLAAQQITPAQASIDRAVAMLGTATHPVIVVGYGAREHMATVLQLAEQLHAPILTTFKAKGQISDTHPLAAGVLGRSGTPIASSCMNESDLLLVLGASFANHTGIARNKPIIQVDYEQMALGKFHPVTLPVWGEIGITAACFSAGLPAQLAAVDQRPEVARLWQQWRTEKARRRGRDQGQGVNSADVFEALSEHCPEDAIIAVDVGNNTYSFGRYFECRNQRVLMSGYLGSIGFGFPAGMGAWVATQEPGDWQDKQVIVISGDGGFGQYMAEFTTAVKYGMNIVHVLLNNSELGKISKEQRGGQWSVWETDLVNPDFAAFADNCGGLGIRVQDAAELDAAIAQALQYTGPTLIEIITDPDLI